MSTYEPADEERAALCGKYLRPSGPWYGVLGDRCSPECAPGSDDVWDVWRT